MESDSEKGTFERTICKGEANCEEFQSARGTDAEKDLKICRAMCRAYPSKVSETPGKNEEFLDDLIEKVFELRNEILAGYRPEETRITVLEFECLKFIAEQFDRFERGLRIETVKFLEFLCKKPMF